MRYKNSDPNNSVEQFAQTTTTINLIAIAKFFEAIYTSIFHQLLNVKSHKNGLLKPVSTSFGIVESNG